MTVPDISSFWLIDSSGECCDRPWAVPGLPSVVRDQLPQELQMKIYRGQPFVCDDITLWLDRRTRGKLSDFPVCDAVRFVVSNRLCDALEPFFGDSVVSRDVEIRSKHKGNVIYKWLMINQGSNTQDMERGAMQFWRVNADQGQEFVDAYGIYFDTATWNGSNVFRMGPRAQWITVTEPVAEAVRNVDLVGVDVIRLDRYGWGDWERYLKTGKTPMTL